MPHIGFSEEELEAAKAAPPQWLVNFLEGAQKVEESKIPLLSEIASTTALRGELLTNGVWKADLHGVPIPEDERAKQALHDWLKIQKNGVKGLVTVVFLLGIPELALAGAATRATGIAKVALKGAEYSLKAGKFIKLGSELNTAREVIGSASDGDWRQAIELAPATLDLTAEALAKSKPAVAALLRFAGLTLKKVGPKEVLGIIKGEQPHVAIDDATLQEAIDFTNTIEGTYAN